MNPKKQIILDSAYSLFIQKGYNATSIQDILDKAGISKGTFYNHFISKTECLIAIMESVSSEIRQKRMETAAGRPVTDPEVLSDQLCIRIRMNRDKNIFSLYESIFYSQEKELKEFAKNSYKKELDWLTSRIIDIYGKKAVPYALDNAAIINGTVLQLINIWKLTTDEEIPTEKLAKFVINQLKVLIPAQIESGEHFIPASTVYTEKSTENLSVDELAEQLEKYSRTSLGDANSTQLIQFLAQELKVESPRKAVLESVLGSLSHLSANEPQLMILLEQVWKKLTQF